MSKDFENSTLSAIKVYGGLVLGCYIGAIGACSIAVISDIPRDARNEKALAAAFNEKSNTVSYEYGDGTLKEYSVTYRGNGQCVVAEAHAPSTLDGSGKITGYESKISFSKEFCP